MNLHLAADILVDEPSPGPATINSSAHVRPGNASQVAVHVPPAARAQAAIALPASDRSACRADRCMLVPCLGACKRRGGLAASRMAEESAAHGYGVSESLGALPSQYAAHGCP